MEQLMEEEYCTSLFIKELRNFCFLKKQQKN